MFIKINSYYCKIRDFLKLKKILNSVCYHVGVYKFFNKRYVGIHLGGGDLRIDSFVNIDVNPYCNVDVISLIDKIKLNEGAVKYIYNSHILEHIPRAKVHKVIAEWYRVLEDGGELYISVPDVETLFNIYLDNLENYDQKHNQRLVDLSCGIIYGGQIDKYDYHYMGYSMVTLKKILEDIGFKDVRRIDVSELPFKKPKDASEAIVDNKLISLNIVAKK